METKQLREVVVYYSNGGKNNAPFSMAVNMAAGVSDAEIEKYFATGKQFNVGTGPFDLMATVEKIEIIK